jgi:redox-sensitive bicupin YhaK (pirin superfamily)
MVSGSLSINGNALEAGDAAVIEKETNLQFTTSSQCEFLLFDLK